MGRGRARVAVCGLAGALALAVAGCGSESHPNDPRPQVATRVSISVNENRVTVQPTRIAFGPERSQPRRLCLSHDPSRRNLAEGHVDYLSRNAIFTYGELCTRLRLAAHDRQRDRSVDRGDAAAAELADLLLAQ